jgi:hypothetical protein
MQDTLPGINTEHKSLLVRGRWQICSEAGAAFIPRTGDIHAQRSWHLQRSLPARSEICERTRCCRRLSVAAYHPLPKSPPAAIGRGVRPVCAPRGLCESGWAAFGLLHYLLWAEGIHRLLQATQAVAGTRTCHENVPTYHVPRAVLVVFERTWHEGVGSAHAQSLD